MPMALAFLSAASAIAFAVFSVRKGFISCVDAVPHLSRALTIATTIRPFRFLKTCSMFSPSTFDFLPVRSRLYSERLQIRHALAHKLFVHLDEVVLYAAGLGGAECLHPVDAPLPDRLLWAASGAAAWRGGRNGRVHVEVLQMH